jgi:hypothetical protein
VSEPAQSEATLRLFGDDLNPDEISALLGCEPEEAWRKGDERFRRSGEPTGYFRKTGHWRINSGRLEPADLDKQINELLRSVTSDVNVWRSLSERYSMDLFAGIFMSTGNDMLELSASTLAALGNRGISLMFDIYDYTDE